MIVLDASVAIEWLLQTPNGARVSARLIREPSETLHAPQLVYLEVTQALRRLVAQGNTTASRAEEAIADMLALRVSIHPHRPYLRRIWQLRDNLTAYDAAYIALAESLDAVLLTCDSRLANAPGHYAKIELVQ